MVPKAKLACGLLVLFAVGAVAAHAQKPKVATEKQAEPVPNASAESAEVVSDAGENVPAELLESGVSDAKPIPKPSEPPPRVEPELTPELAALKVKVRKALATYYKKNLNTRDHDSWEIMHSLIAYGVHSEVYRDGPSGRKVNAIGHLLWGGRCKGQSLITLQGGRLNAGVGVGVQGHAGQFMGMLAQSAVQPSYAMNVGGKSFTVEDLIEEEKLDCKAGTELTFKLIGLSYYLKSDDTWKSRDGQTWSIPRLIQEEIKQPIRGAACGGTHRLFGLSSAYLMRKKQGQPIEGEYLRAQKFISDYHRYTFGQLQNPDGSFSTEWFARRGNRPDIDRKIQTSGHIAEWLAFSLSDAQLRDPKMMKAIGFLADTLNESPNRKWSIGPLGHSLHALVIYDGRVFRARSPASRVPDTAALHGAGQSMVSEGGRSQILPAMLPTFNPRFDGPAARMVELPATRGSVLR